MEKREIIEALIFVSDGARSLKDIRQVLPDLTADDVEALVAELNRIYEQSGRSFRIIAAAEGYLFVTRPEFTPPVIYSREARDRLVYLVEARPSVRLNPGLPVDVTPLGPGR